ncbi:hypothetical protein ACFL7M_11490 [Thermodesulfobacteriota bacterium]
MKNIMKIIVISMMTLFSSISFAADLTADHVRKGIIGEWQLLSFERNGKIIDDYSGEEVIWRFMDDGTMSLSDRQLGEFKDKYRVVKSNYGWIGKGGIIILIMELKKRGFSYPKFMVRGMTPDGKLLLGDWDDTLIYRLQRVK